MSKMNISRRSLLQGMGAGVLGAALGAKLTLDAPRALAQTAPISQAFYRTTLGDYEVTVIRDGVNQFDVEGFFASADTGEVNDLLAANGFPTGVLANNFKQMLVNTGDDLVLMDTGFGPGGQVGGQLIPTLELIGVSPEDITVVALSHWHPDHINGTTIDGAPAYPNARYVMPQAEWDFLNENAEANQGAAGALNTLQPIVDADQLAFYNSEDEIVSGIQAVAAMGHTAGHHAFLVESNGDALLNTFDAIFHPVIHVQRPEWSIGFDGDPMMAAETRRSLLERIAGENLLMFGYHFPFPGIGVVAPFDDSFRFTPLSY